MTPLFNTRKTDPSGAAQKGCENAPPSAAIGEIRFDYRSKLFFAALALYLLLATAVSTTNIRHLLLAFPLIWPLPDEATTTAGRRRRLALVALLAVFGLLMQWVWISQFLVLDGIGRQPTP